MSKGNYNIIRRIPIIHKAIASGRYPNKNSLAQMISKELHDDQLSVSTIGNDIEFLRNEYNAPIEFDYSKNGYYYSKENYILDIFKPVQPFSITHTLEKERFSKITGLDMNYLNTVELYTHLDLPDESDFNIVTEFNECGRYFYQNAVWIGLRKFNNESDFKLCVSVWESLDGDKRISKNFQMHFLNYTAEYWPLNNGYWLFYQFDFNLLDEEESIAKFELKKIINYVFPVDD